MNRISSISYSILSWTSDGKGRQDLNDLFVGNSCMDREQNLMSEYWAAEWILFRYILDTARIEITAEPGQTSFPFFPWTVGRYTRELLNGQREEPYEHWNRFSKPKII